MGNSLQESSSSLFSFVASQNREPNPAASVRKFHIRRLYDLLLLCIGRGDMQRAMRAWSILARCKEFDWLSMWKIGLLLTSKVAYPRNTMYQIKDVDFLKSIMPRSQSPNEKQAILKELLLRLASSGRYKDAMDQLELYLPQFPYQANPVLHTYAGLFSLLLSFDGSAEELRMDDTHQHKARSHFTSAIAIDPENRVASAFLSRFCIQGAQRFQNNSDINTNRQSDDDTE